MASSVQLVLSVLRSGCAQPAARRPNPDYAAAVQREALVPAWRRQLTEWLCDVSGEFRLGEDTTALAVNFLDRLLSAVVVPSAQLQTASLACLFIASKLLERRPLSMRQVAKYFREIASPDDVSCDMMRCFALGMCFAAQCDVAPRSALPPECSARLPACSSSSFNFPPRTHASKPLSLSLSLCLCFPRSCPLQVRMAELNILFYLRWDMCAFTALDFIRTALQLVPDPELKVEIAKRAEAVHKAALLGASISLPYIAGLHSIRPIVLPLHFPPSAPLPALHLLCPSALSVSLFSLRLWHAALPPVRRRLRVHRPRLLRPWLRCGASAGWPGQQRHRNRGALPCLAGAATLFVPFTGPRCLASSALLGV